MNDKMGIPRYIDGINPEDIPFLAGRADKECNPLYPVPVLMDEAQLERMYYVVGSFNKKSRAAENVHKVAN
jgi:hypothetical protein